MASFLTVKEDGHILSLEASQQLPCHWQLIVSQEDAFIGGWMKVSSRRVTSGR